MQIRDFNPFLFLPEKAIPNAPTTSWWVDAQAYSVQDWYIRARQEAPRMSASPEAKTIHPKCLDDIK